MKTRARPAALVLAFSVTVAGCLGVTVPPLDTPLPGLPTGAPTGTLPATAAPSATDGAALPRSPDATSRPTARPIPAPPTASATLGPTPTATIGPTPTATVAPTAAPTPTTTAPPALGSAPTGPTETAHVVRVVDGDTIRVRVGGVEYPVRYIGIDTPETVDPRRPVEWMGKEAARANRRLVEGGTVVLEKDVSDTDRYDRLLRYVWVDDGGSWLLVNLELVRRGFAHVSTYPPDVKYTDLYLVAQREARQAGRGLWGDAPDPAPSAKPTPEPAKKPKSRRGCDPSYPTVCIAPSPPDLDCGDISFRRFKVLPPDPHRFDGHHDGIGCESG